MDTLIEFLRARLDEDEKQARRAGVNQASNQLRAMFARDGSHSLLVIDPARVLAEVALKRRIIESYTGLINVSRYAWPQEPVGDALWRSAEAGTRELLQLAAAMYADHPDYREEWRL